ncbi:MAG: alpha/beta fold hydrolase [Opitutae bacterium]|nr:alpha/beta fold hydrolase [Opitutae bacterium]MBT5379760.1 alpha/beta fold hydrolase [Opitutae bacterium]MBT5692284.1 alpha/beta fold hydrolase [Opitutae bacterium]MBT6463852.1 alpha/beta fold hydrolase [Opitutae bacterium]MBT7852050.1 alpha/beta fold hydrolase [Opitutae bacterium]
MKQLILYSLALGAVVSASGQNGETQAQARARKYPALPEGVERGAVTIWSDGTRMAGDLYLPKDRKPNQKLPAIVFANGTGGAKRKLPVRLGPVFASNGYAFLAFDYRGWGESDSQLMMVQPMPETDETGEVMVKARAIRWQVDFAGQVEDIRNAIAFLVGEPGIDGSAIGLLGTSYGGGLVTWVAAHEPRVKCLVMQVPGMAAGRSGKDPFPPYALKVKQARGETEPVPYKTQRRGKKGSRYYHMRYNTARSIDYVPVATASQIKVPTLIIDVEKDELLNFEKNGKRVADILKKEGTIVKHHLLNGATHYSIYNEHLKHVLELQIDWLNEHLKN